MFRSPMSATRPQRERRSPGELSLAATLAGAVDMALMHSGMTHESLGARLGYSRAYITMLQAGKRRWTAEAILKVCRVTGDYTPIQWLCERAGGIFEYDEIRAELERAQAEADEATAKVERLKQRKSA